MTEHELQEVSLTSETISSASSSLTQRISVDSDSLKSQANFSEGDVVETRDGKRGVLGSIVTETFTWTDGEQVEATDENPAYVVGLLDGGADYFRANEIRPSEWEEDQGEKDTKDLKEDMGDFKLSHIYHTLDDPDDLDEFRSQKAKLANIPGDDPEVGFSSMPNGWTRKSVVQAWASLGGTWTSCYSHMSKKKGPRFSRRWCSAMKDEFYGTEAWRGKW